MSSAPSTIATYIHTLSKYCSDYLFRAAQWVMLVGLLSDTIMYLMLIFIYDAPLFHNVPQPYMQLLFYVLKTLPMLFMGTLLWVVVLEKKYTSNLRLARDDAQLFLYLMHKTGFQFLIPPLGYTVAFVFSAAGDAFLAHNTLNAESNPHSAHNTLLMGIAAFLVAQLAFAISFSLNFRQNRRNIVLLGNHWQLSLPFLLFAAFLFLIICTFCEKSLSSSIKVAVGAYALVIATMGWRAAAAYKESTHRNKNNALMRLAGALIFMCSDSLIALRTFLTTFTLNVVSLGGALTISHDAFGKWMSFFIMVTYWLAQILITLSIGETVDEHNSMMLRQMKA
eukprot:CAMPEP_0117448374 /NCGR_PEP_ID=MMETSP0759-20121206/7365_1 /TAXON_ID=63605 /ORGANISM="Percolomonas cosmopolitus, Strain WS" /LENGTH=336 /DNA_ID=CAMNT_0005240753 /DNA_START=1195 /DNA_END=2205 /DNA_ORIENTATION=+